MQPDPPTLSDQQERVFALLADGFIYDEIAAQMDLSKQTVKEYAQNAKAKFGARTMIEAIVKADRAGLIKREVVIYITGSDHTTPICPPIE